MEEKKTEIERRTHTLTHRERGSHKKRQTDRQIDRPRKRNRNKQGMDGMTGNSVWGRPRTFLFEQSWIRP